jgi:hypothetical protein
MATELDFRATRFAIDRAEAMQNIGINPINLNQILKIITIAKP